MKIQKCFPFLWCTFFLVVTLNSTMLADEVILKNGDRLSGEIVSFDGKTLMLKTDFAGQIEIKWSAVQGITSDQRLHVQSSTGQKLVGPITTQDSTFAIATRTNGVVLLPKQQISSIRNEGEQSAYEASLHPGLRQNWDAGTTLGFALTRGNSETKNLAIAFNADRKTLHDKLALYSNIVYSTNDAPGAVPSTTANTEQGGIRYDHDITPRLFAFAGADFQSDALQTLDLRSVLGGGLGFHAIKADTTTLDFLGGFNYTHEAYTAFSRSFAAATLGDEFMHKLHGTTVLTQSFYFFPNLSDTGEYRITLNLGTVTKISKWLGWQNSFGDIYVTNPPAGKKKNDIVFTTGLNISFVHAGASK